MRSGLLIRLYNSSTTICDFHHFCTFEKSHHPHHPAAAHHLGDKSEEKIVDDDDDEFDGDDDDGKDDEFENSFVVTKLGSLTLFPPRGCRLKSSTRALEPAEMNHKRQRSDNKEQHTSNLAVYLLLA